MNKNLKEALAQTRNGRIFSVLFIKRTTGLPRKMVCRRGVRSHLKGGGAAYDFEEQGLVSVFDVQKRGYRCIPLESIVWIQANGKTYRVQS